jgi:hypothetical protein
MLTTYGAACGWGVGGEAAMCFGDGQSKNHTNRNQSYKAHRNGIKKPKNHKFKSSKGVSVTSGNSSLSRRERGGRSSVRYRAISLSDKAQGRICCSKDNQIRRSSNLGDNTANVWIGMMRCPDAGPSCVGLEEALSNMFWDQGRGNLCTRDRQ